ncbi:hypothetical protein V3C99_006576, partial [Haemonchus contortus]
MLILSKSLRRVSKQKGRKAVSKRW